MKYLIFILILLNLMSCSKSDQVSLDLLKADEIGKIPFMMHHMKIDSVAEIMTLGELATAKKKDTLNLYIRLNDSVVFQRTKSMWCCHYTYQYDALGIISKRSTISDFKSENNFSYNIERENIVVNENSSYNDSKRHVYVSQNNHLFSKTSTHKVDTSYSEIVKYEFNKSGQLIKKYSETKNHPTGEFDYMIVLNNYLWIGDVLKEIQSKQFNNNAKDFYETITLMDNSGFPISRSVIHNKDTIYKTIIRKL